MEINYSIIIPHHNTPELLYRCLDSIPEREDIQIIVVDDNSEDDKKPQCNKSNLEIVYLTKIESKGAGRARNVGLAKAKGKWLLFADADDFFVDNFVDKISTYLASDNDMILFKADSVDCETLEPANRNMILNSAVDSFFQGVLSSREVSLSTHVPWCRLIKRSIIEQHSIKFDEVIASNDTMFTTKVSCLSNDIAISNETLYVVTYRKGSLWDKRRTDPNNYLARLEVQIRRNRYLAQFGYKKTQIIGSVIKSIDFGPLTFLKALFLCLRYNAFCDGFSQILKHNRN